MATGNMYRKFCEVWLCRFFRYASQQRDMHTDRHANSNSSHPSQVIRAQQLPSVARAKDSMYITPLEAQVSLSTGLSRTISNTSSSHMPCSPLRVNMTSSIKLEVHNVLQCCQRRTEPRP